MPFVATHVPWQDEARKRRKVIAQSCCCWTHVRRFPFQVITCAIYLFLDWWRHQNSLSSYSSNQMHYIGSWKRPAWVQEIMAHNRQAGDWGGPDFMMWYHVLPYDTSILCVTLFMAAVSLELRWHRPGNLLSSRCFNLFHTVSSGQELGLARTLWSQLGVPQWGKFCACGVPPSIRLNFWILVLTGCTCHCSHCILYACQATLESAVGLRCVVLINSMIWFYFSFEHGRNGPVPYTRPWVVAWLDITAWSNGRVICSFHASSVRFCTAPAFVSANPIRMSKESCFSDCVWQLPANAPSVLELFASWLNPNDQWREELEGFIVAPFGQHPATAWCLPVSFQWWKVVESFLASQVFESLL